jgi:hypothetical protein
MTLSFTPAGPAAALAAAAVLLGACDKLLPPGRSAEFNLPSAQEVATPQTPAAAPGPGMSP